MRVFIYGSLWWLVSTCIFVVNWSVVGNADSIMLLSVLFMIYEVILKAYTKYMYLL